MMPPDHKYVIQQTDWNGDWVYEGFPYTPPEYYFDLEIARADLANFEEHTGYATKYRIVACETTYREVLSDDSE